MNTVSASSCKTLSEFLKTHTASKGDTITNTRISGGSYNVPDEEYDQFMRLVYADVIAKDKEETLTEKQRETGPILVDIDLRFAFETDARIYTLDHITDLVDIYLAELKTMFQFDANTNFNVYIFEKESINKVVDKNIVKDGIHIIFGLNADRQVQCALRDKIVSAVGDIWSDLPIINTWDDVFDAGISKGHTNWQMIGSRKPAHQPYRLTRTLNVSFDVDDEEFITKTIEFDMKNIVQLSARNLNAPSYYIKTEFAATLGNVVVRPKHHHVNAPSILNIKSQAELDAAVNHFLDTIPILEYELKESYEYTMTLPVSYYGEGSFSKWIRVGWALRNINDKLFIAWLAFSAQAASFKFTDVHDLYSKWTTFDMNNTNGLTNRSLMHWSKCDAYDKYKDVKANSIDSYINKTLEIMNMKSTHVCGCGDYDIANVLYQLYKDDYVCVSVKSNIWYRYKDNRWIENDNGTGLRKSISTTLRDLYHKKAIQISNKHSNLDVDDTTRAPMEAASKHILKICENFANTSAKKNIMIEAKDLFYDPHFFEKLDANPYLLCFKNGVIDFKEKVFRRGYPEDYLSKCTNINYIPNVESGVKSEIEDFMRKLFPMPELCQYMWEHLASTLIGTSADQTFNMYVGIGQNGKSVLVNLMEQVLGEYKGDVPLTLVTQARTKIGGLTPELVALKGVRYAVMQEPSKGDRMNEGIMKQITSGLDPITCRAPYMVQSLTYIPQFKLVVCANELMEIKAQDHGTWRRIRVPEFMSLFTDNPIEGDSDKPYQYKLDKNIVEKFGKWKEGFAAMLAEIAFRTNGVVKECSIVTAASNAYRERQDYIAEFIHDRIILDGAGLIRKAELNSEFSIWYMSTYGKGGPSPKDVHAYMDKRFGKYEKRTAWVGAKFKYDDGNVSDDEIEL